MLSGLGVVDIKGMLNSYSFYTDEDYAENNEGKEKVISVNIGDNLIETYVSGPLTRKGGELSDIRVPMKIAIKDDGILININENEYVLKPGEWSNMIRVKFKIGFLVETYGILKFYLLSTKPKFRLYMSSIQIDPENQVVDITYPQEYGKELVDSIGLFYTLGMPEDKKAVTEKTRVIMPTQLNGRTCDMDALRDIADQRGLIIIEDAAQALGSRFKDKFAGTFGLAGTFSFYPAKLLGCYGDTLARTPHIDRLASQGMRFTNAFTTAPVCAPNHACLVPVYCVPLRIRPTCRAWMVGSILSRVRE